MKIDLYHLCRGFHFSKIAYPIVIDVLRVWVESSGWEVRVSICQEHQVDLETDADVVGFSVYSQTAPGSYRAARELRRRGKLVQQHTGILQSVQNLMARNRGRSLGANRVKRLTY